MLFLRKTLFISMLMLLPWMTVAQERREVQGRELPAGKPKTLKELVAEEKAAKEAERKAREAEKAKEEAERKAREEAEKARKARQDAAKRGEAVPEDVADIVTLTDSALWAPTNVRPLGAQDYGELTQPVSS